MKDDLRQANFLSGRQGRSRLILECQSLGSLPQDTQHVVLHTGAAAAGYTAQSLTLP